MGTPANQVMFRDVRCPQCHKMVNRISSTSSAKLEVKCVRCRVTSIIQVSTGA